MCYHIHIITNISRVLDITIPSTLATVWYINIYSYNITQAYQSHILPYSRCVSLLIKCEYGNIHTYPPHLYHVVNLSYYWATFCTVRYRPINPVFTVYYACLITGQFLVVICRHSCCIFVLSKWWFCVRLKYGVMEPHPGYPLIIWRWCKSLLMIDWFLVESHLPSPL